MTFPARRGGLDQAGLGEHPQVSTHRGPRDRVTGGEQPLDVDDSLRAVDQDPQDPATHRVGDCDEDGHS